MCRLLGLGGGVGRCGFGEDRGRRRCRFGFRRNSGRRMGGRCGDVSFDRAKKRGDVPCYAYRLRHLERCFECFPVGWCDSVDSEPDSYEDESWIEAACLCCGDLVDLVLVHIWTVCINVYTES